MTRRPEHLDTDGVVRKLTRRVMCLTVLLLLSLPTQTCWSQAEQPESGDYIFCSPNWWFPYFSTFGHGAIYVGAYGGTRGDVVERDTNGIRFRFLADLRLQYPTVRTTRVVAVPPSLRLAAAARAVDVATQIADGTYVPWYSDPYVLGFRDCIGTVKHFYLDAGATLDQVGSPDDATLPGGAYRYYATGRDWDQTITGNGGVLTGGSQGGIESRPLWLGGSFPHPAVPASEILQDLLPTQGLHGEVGYAVTPDVLGVSNAVAAVGMDYVDGSTGQTVASILGTETVDAVYEHDYAVCARVRALELNDLFTVPADSSWWWMMNTVSASGDSSEVALLATLRVDAGAVIIDSKYPGERYGTTSGQYLNYQIRAANPVDAMYLLEGITREAAARFDVSYGNTADPPQPVTFIRQAGYLNPGISLTVENRDTLRTVRFYGSVWGEARSDAVRWVDFTLPVEPGVSSIELPVGRMYDAVIFAEADSALDKAYVPSGRWFSFDDRPQGGTSEASLTLDELLHDRFTNAETTFVSPPRALMTGTVTTVLPWSYIGIAYSPNQEREPIDVSGDFAVAFFVRGDGGQYRMKLETASVLDNDYYGAFFTAPPTWTLVVVPFSELAQEGWGTPVPWTGTDLHTISFVTTTRPLASVELEVDRISFVTSEVTSAGTPTHSPGVQIRVAPNPASGSARLILEAGAPTSATLEVFDLAGRRVRSLLEMKPLAQGRTIVLWDGRNDRGAVVAAGTYLVRLASGSRWNSVKLLVLH